MARMPKPGTKLGRKRNTPVKQLKGPVTKDNMGRVKAKKGQGPLEPKTQKPKGPVSSTAGQTPEKGQADWRGWVTPQKPRRPGGVRSYQR